MRFFKTSSYVQLFIASSLFFGNISVAFPALSLLGLFVFILVFCSLVVFAVMNLNKLGRSNFGILDQIAIIRAFIPSIVLFIAFLVLFIIGGVIAIL